jgi:RNA polymerase sigma-B factor
VETAQPPPAPFAPQCPGAAIIDARTAPLERSEALTTDVPDRTSAAMAGARAREDHELFVRCRAGEPAAREALVERFLPLARQLARRYQRADEPLDDLTQVASLGLLKAIDRFDHTRDIAFSSYAVPTILGEVKRHFRDRTWAVRVPRDLQELSLRVDRAISSLSRELRRAPSVGEIAEAVGASEEQVLEAREAAGAYRAASFDAPRIGGDDDGGAGGDTMGDAFGLDDGGFGLAEDRATIDRLMQSIAPREREVLRLRFVEDLTQAEIGARIGVSQMQVSRLIRQSLGRLRATAGEEG